GQGDDEGECGAEDHPPERDAELGSVGLCADGGELEILVGGQLGDEGGEECEHPELAEEDECEDDEDEDGGCEDSFHDFDEDTGFEGKADHGSSRIDADSKTRTTAT